MNNQFSQRVSDIITYSKEEANRLKNRYIGPEHLLLGMLRDGGGKAIEILQKLDIDLNRVKKRLEGFLKEIEDDNLLPDADIPLSPMAAKILKMCILEARLLKSATADTEHVLLAILKDGNNLAATVLEENNIDYKSVFEQLSMKASPNAGMGFTEDDDEEEVYKLVTSVRGNSLKNYISIESPIGKAIRGAKVGDRVYVKVNDKMGYYAVIRSITDGDDSEDEIRPY